MPSSVVVAFNASEIRRLLGSSQGPVWADIQMRGNRVLRHARRIVPVDQGQLKQSLVMEMRQERGVPIAVVGSSLKYALYVHEGTGLYSKKGREYIRPVTAKVLRWPMKNNSGRGIRRYSGGKTAGYVYSMKSRGFPGRPFLRDALPAATS